MIQLTNQQARQFLLLKHGLLGEYRFIGKQGALDFVRQAGCIQFDPVDVCGKNAELTLQSRVKGFTKKTLYELLYQDRMLIDYPDKNLSIIPAEDWPYFQRYRKAAVASAKQFSDLPALEQQAKAYIEEHGAVSSDDLPIRGDIRWHSAIHWSGNWHGTTHAARAVLEQMYSTGELIIHHKEGARKYYDLACRHLPESLRNTPDPFPEEFAHHKWRIFRRIGAVGLLWNRPSDAWLNIWGLDSSQRARAFEELEQEGKILAVQAEGIKGPLYCQASDAPLLETALQNNRYKPRCELLAPLDCLMWDRKLIYAVFGFQYQWEIYTPKEKRKYGYYVLPMIYGDQFVGRLEAAAQGKNGVLMVKNIWFEDGVRQNGGLMRAVEGCIKRLAKLNQCKEILREDHENRA